MVYNSGSTRTEGDVNDEPTHDNFIIPKDKVSQTTKHSTSTRTHTAKYCHQP